MAKIFLSVGYIGATPQLRPYDAEALKVMQKWKIGDVVAATVKRPRSVQHHRKLFAMLQLVWEGTAVQDTYPRVENLLDALKLAMGHCEPVSLPDGTTAMKIKSIAFESMGQDEFNAFYDQAVDIVVERLVPHLNREDLERQVMELCDG